ncbi:hypothetical protein [Streptomyces sp. NPDC093600]|uniref:hypothetical protein n=1 Tax=Streptomyces sp. NPDC093600 TaxID=3366047 RepID=UPI00381D3A43
MDVDVDAVASELYGLVPAEFTAARNSHVARAREAGDGEAARRIAGLRKPTLGAWASTLLVRHRPEETERLLHLGHALREAHRTLDGARLRELGHRQHAVLAALARQASDLAAEAGQPVGDGVVREIEEILRTVLTDEQVAGQWATGVLERAPAASVGFIGLEPEPTAVPTPPKPGGTTARKDRPQALEQEEGEKEEQERKEREKEEREKQRKEAVAAARRRAERAARELRKAEEARDGAGRRLAQAEDRLADLERRRREAERSRDQAREDAEAAARRAGEAERAATAAREALERLAGSG